MSREFHEKIASAIEALAQAQEKAAQQTKAEPRPTTTARPKTASPVNERYARLTGEELPDEVADNPAAVEAIRKVASASSAVNELGDPGDRPDRGTGRPSGRTRAERVKEAYSLFGDDLLKD